MNIQFAKEEQISVILDRQADAGIRKIWAKVSEDIRAVAGADCKSAPDGASAAQAVIVCTCGQELAERLKERVPELAGLSGKWECYWFGLAERPLPGVERGLVIAGSDKLGTIYGMFRLSELLGVTAWGFWGDVTPPKYDRVVLSDGPEQEQAGGVLCRAVQNGMSKEPAVQFRGFFINDEWPCFGNWATSHYGGFNAKMYDHVFEYLLRMRGNYLWPAMWSSNFLLDGPGLAAMELATEYGIYIGMSHHEPCMRSGEEFTLFKGPDSPYGTEWDYAANTEGLLRFWEDGLKRVKGQTAFPTIGMRGERDSKMLGEDSTIEENVRLLKEIIRRQRGLIGQHLNEDVDSVPQLFAIYKEVEDYYFGDGQMEGIRGYDELKNVTLLFCDDNFGNMRALPQAEEQDHPGGFGMYYHLDYHGSPISYEWVNSTPLPRIWEQMREVYEYGVRRLWIVNVGDVKFQEYSLGYFMNLAFDVDGAMGEKNSYESYTLDWLNAMFGGRMLPRQLRDAAWVLEESVRLHGLRRAESLNDAVWHPAHYLESRKMAERAEALEQKNEELYRELSGTPVQDGYYSMIYFPAAAIANLIKMHLYSGWNHLCASQGKAVANRYGQQVRACMERDRELAEEMAEFSGGKWKGMERASHIGFVNWNDEDWRYPVVHEITLPPQPRLVVSRADETRTFTNQYFPIPLCIDDFLFPGTEQVILQIANGGAGAVEWEIPERPEFLKLSAYRGRTELQDEIEVRILWDKLEPEREAKAVFHVQAGRESVPVCVRAKKQEFCQVPEGAFVMQDGLCVMDAADCREIIGGSFAKETVRYERLNDYGKYGSGMKVLPSTAIFGEQDLADGTAPGLGYDVWTPEGGPCELVLHTSPANPLIYGGHLRVGVAVNGTPAQLLDITGDAYRGGDGTCRRWADAVLNQEHTAKLPIELRAGLNRITLYAQDAGLVLERLTICRKGAEMKESYRGPARSYQKTGA